MNEELDALTQPFLHKTMAESTIEEIRAVTQSYPYFVPAQLALLKKLNQENDPAYEAQLQKAVLYYYDPLQFEAFIHTENFLTDFHFETPDTTESIADTAPDIVEDIAEEATESPIAIVMEPAPEEEAIATTIDEPVILAETALQEPNRELTAEPEAAVPEENEEDKESLTFEPYHTVDYFASQGIKLSQEEVSTDRFGKQLKSFTEWLKTMKRLPAATIDKNIDATGEHKVQNLAEHSIEKTDIVTETMAEVWLKQGNIEKAIDVYNKLSLQNPSKRAYFAAKIDQLKKVP
ncbi:MAG: hypothetical protein ACTHK0_11820 [Ginsengibacter sp.]